MCEQRSKMVNFKLDIDMEETWKKGKTNSALLVQRSLHGEHKVFLQKHHLMISYLYMQD